MYYVLLLTSKKNISIKQKRKFIDSLWGTREKLGMMSKFAKATSNPFMPEMKIKETLMDSIFATPFKSTVVEFYFEQDGIYIAKKWEKFLNKVYPDLQTHTEGALTLPSNVDFVVSYLFSDMMETPVNLECSLDIPLSSDEIEVVKNLVNEMKSDNLYYVCRQFRCKTCEEHNSQKPFHFELENHYTSSYIKKQSGHPNANKKTCPTCEEFLYMGTCEICEHPYEFKM